MTALTLTLTEQDLSELEAIAAGETPPLDARMIVRRILNSGATDAAERIYAAFREIIFRTLVSRGFTDELVNWFDVFKQIAAMLRGRGLDGLAERLRVLSDLAGQAVRFAETHPVKEVLERKHVRRILEVLQGKGGSAQRADLGKKLGIGEANLSRIISNLVVSGLVERRFVGREAELRLTNVARTALQTKQPRPVEEAATEADASIDWRDWPVPIALCNADGALVHHNAAFAAHDPDTVFPAGETGTLSGWLDGLKARSLDVENSEDGSPHDLRVGNEEWIRIDRRRLPDGKELVLWHDVSADKRGLRDAKLLADRWAIEEAALRRQIADAEAKRLDLEHRLKAYRLSQHLLREDLVGRLARLSNSLDAMKHGDYGDLYGNLLEGQGQLRGLQRTVETMFDVPGIGGAASDILEAFDPRRYLEEMVQIVQPADKNIQWEYGELHQVQAAPALRASLNYLLCHTLEALGANPDRGRLMAEIQNASLVVEMHLQFNDGRPDRARSALPLPWPGYKAADFTFGGLSYCGIIAKDYGGSLEVNSAGRNALQFKLSFPVRELAEYR